VGLTVSKSRFPSQLIFTGQFNSVSGFPARHQCDAVHGTLDRNIYVEMLVPPAGIEPATFGLQIRPEAADLKRVIADYWFADKPLRDMIVDVR